MLKIHYNIKINLTSFKFRSASAFNFSKVFIISKSEDKKSLKLAKLRKEFGFFGSQGTDKLMEFSAFSTLKEAKDFFIENKISVCGVEIGKESKNIVKRPFIGSTVFIMGNEVIYILKHNSGILYICLIKGNSFSKKPPIK